MEKIVTKNIRKILLFKSGAIGDVLMTTPFVRELRKLFRKARIDYLVGNWSKDVLIGNNNINRIRGFDDSVIFKRKLLKLLKLLKYIKKEKYDICFVLDRSYLANLFIYFTGIPIRIGFDRNKEGIGLTHKIVPGKKHHIYEYLDLLNFFNVKSKDTKMDISLSKKDKEFANKLFKKYKLSRKDKIIGIAPLGVDNPGLVRSYRRWKKENYIELINTLNKKNKIILFGGPYDVEESKDVVKKIKGDFINLIGKTTIKQAVALMKNCNLFITHDSGPMHMAAAAGTTVISLFGPTSPLQKAPIGKKHRFIWEKEKCRECLKSNRYQECTHKDIMEKIKVKDVLKLVENIR